MSSDFMRQAIALALENIREGGGPFAAVVVKDGAVVATGVNRVTATNDPTAHAEIVAIREACKILKGFQLDDCEIYTTCEPCPMCLGAIYWARPARVYYASTASDAAAAGFDDAFIYEELQVPAEERRIPMEELQREESLVIFQEWLAKSDKTPY
ncbi:MAG TPA: nucleoside deaminase [Candidatus Dormibacteraeota bacterium]|jgi:guanine deaminase|nr:nucleoside deaminase [Candidatus Dormibacteraeota bacterium]